ncbi:DUF3078 domain-containing protein [Sphingobacterium rhinopitheci]|uniref:DUF3078 domain-containing protein n=1 Tax=Sphingobacterium rhinopitheci TaxID=2781960 RepID=UPI001F51705E|nr:DUF3078 domain-containing protein [Sphingobacterium rhinopitheci]MCI0919975.1 DUF3078 domain-containing protein [Sphingobacterium rhinopitheci]
MKTYLFFMLLLMSINISNAQNIQDSIATKHSKKDSNQHKKNKIDSTTTKHWNIKGTTSLSGNQSAFSNWLNGGTSNITVNLRLNYDFNYKKDNWVLDNKFITAYGFNRNKFSSVKKTEDKIELNSILARNIEKEWHYSFFFNFKSQFGKGLDPKDPKNKVSHFLSPIFLMTGPGIFWRKSDNFKINFSPATPRFVFVHSEFTKMGKSFGVSQNEVHRFEFGSTVYAYYKFDIMKNVTMENILGLFADYTHDFSKVDIDYQASLYLKVNKFISANVYYDVLYDYDTSKKLQQKETVGIGFKYSF